MRRAVFIPATLRFVALRVIDPGVGVGVGVDEHLAIGQQCRRVIDACDRKAASLLKDNGRTTRTRPDYHQASTKKKAEDTRSAAQQST